MRSRTGWLAGLVAAAALGGCGTANNICPPAQPGESTWTPYTRVYGGVRGDVSEMRLNMRFDDVSCMNLVFLPITVPLFLIDVSLSAVGDTLTLPYAIACEYRRHRTTPPPPTPSDPASVPVNQGG